MYDPLFVGSNRDDSLTQESSDLELRTLEVEEDETRAHLLYLNVQGDNREAKESEILLNPDVRQVLEVGIRIPLRTPLVDPADKVR